MTRGRIPRITAPAKTDLVLLKVDPFFTTGFSRHMGSPVEDFFSNIPSPVILTGDGRVKSEFTVQAVNLDRGNQGPDAVILGNALGYSYDVGDDSVFSFEIPYDCDTSEDLKIEVYWYIDEARDGTNQEVQFRLQWSACPADETEAIDAPTHTGTIDFGDKLIPAVAKHLTEFSGTIAAASITDSDYVSCTIDRIAIDGGAAPTADPVIVQIEIEYTINKLGKAT